MHVRQREECSRCAVEQTYILTPRLFKNVKANEQLGHISYQVVFELKDFVSPGIVSLSRFNRSCYNV